MTVTVPASVKTVTALQSFLDTQGWHTEVVLDHDVNLNDGTLWLRDNILKLSSPEPANHRPLLSCDNDVPNRNIVEIDVSTVTLEGFHVRGPNASWGQYTAKQNEFSHGIRSHENRATINLCEVDHVYGDAIYGPGHRLACHLHHTGRIASTMMWNYATLIGCLIHHTHHSAYDLEGGHNRVNNIVIYQNTFGGPHGGSITCPVDNLFFAENSSTQAQVNAGLIETLCPIARSYWWGTDRPYYSHNWIMANNHFDDPMTVKIKGVWEPINGLASNQHVDVLKQMTVGDTTGW